MTQKTFIQLDRARAVLFTFTNTCMFEDTTGQSFLMFMQLIKASPSSIKFSDIASLTYCGLYVDGACDLSRQEFNRLMNDYCEKNSVVGLIELVGKAINSSVFVQKMIDEMNKKAEADVTAAKDDAEKK